MRIWMLAALLLAVTAIGGDRGMETSSRFFDRVVAMSSRSNPFNEFQQSERAAADKQCCKVCSKGTPCEDTCIEKDDVCHVPPGCACS
jgi:hypothetical protein